MYILSDKIVTTRKKHMCNCCCRSFEAGTKMRTQVNTFDGIQTWRECPTCTILLSNHREYFDDGYGICYEGCVSDSLSKGQTPENLLVELNFNALKKKLDKMEKKFKNVEITMTLDECEKLNIELRDMIKQLEDSCEALGGYFVSDSFREEYPKVNELLKTLGIKEEMPF